MTCYYQRWFMDFSKLLHRFVKVVRFISCPLRTKPSWRFQSFCFEPKVLKYSMPWVLCALDNVYFHLSALSKFKSSIFLLTFLDQLITPPHCLSTSTVCLQIISTIVAFVWRKKTSLAQFKPIFGKSNTLRGLVKMGDCQRWNLSMPSLPAAV